MKKVMNLKSMMLAALAMFAVSTMAVNNHHDGPVINQQWEVENIAAFFNNDSAQLEKYSGVVIDLTEAGTFRTYYKFKEDEKWYTMGSGQAVIEPTDETTGTIKLQDVTFNYTLSGENLTLTNESTTLNLKQTPGFAAAPKTNTTE